MKFIIATVIWMSLPFYVFGQTFSEWIETVENGPQSDRQAIIDSYIDKHKSFPLIEGKNVYIIYNGSKDSMSVAGDFTGWNPANARMEHIKGSQLWYKSFSLASAARVQYKLVSRDVDWFKDPLNPIVSTDGNDNSEIRMPDYYEFPAINFNPDISHGVYSQHAMMSSHLNQERNYGIYLPWGYETSEKNYPIVIVNDGFAYVEKAKMNNVLDYLISNEIIRPIIAVYVPPVARTQEYAQDHKPMYTAFIIEELLPLIQAEYRTENEASSRAIIGSSYGGNISLWVAMHHDDIFGNVGAFSPYIEAEIINTFNYEEIFNLVIYLNNGLYDHLKPVQESVKNFIPILEERQYRHAWAEYPEAHNYGFWGAHLGDALRLFFPYNRQE